MLLISADVEACGGGDDRKTRGQTRVAFAEEVRFALSNPWTMLQLDVCHLPLSPCPRFAICNPMFLHNCCLPWFQLLLASLRLRRSRFAVSKSASLATLVIRLAEGQALLLRRCRRRCAPRQRRPEHARTSYQQTQADAALSQERATSLVASIVVSEGTSAPLSEELSKASICTEANSKHAREAAFRSSTQTLMPPLHTRASGPGQQRPCCSLQGRGRGSSTSTCSAQSCGGVLNRLLCPC